MITLHKFLTIMALDCYLELFNNKTSEKLLEGCRSTITLPTHLYDCKVIYFIPGIVTKVWIDI